MYLIQTDSLTQKIHGTLASLGIQVSPTEGKYFSVFTLIFVALSGLALHYQQYITSAVLYIVAIMFDLLDEVMSKVTDVMSIIPLARVFR